MAIAWRRIFFKFVFKITFWLLASKLSAQDSVNLSRMPIACRLAGYYDFPGSIGLVAGMELPVKSRVLMPSLGNQSGRTRYRDLLLGADLGYYHYDLNHSGFFLLPSIGVRYRRSRPYYFQWMLKAGLLRTFYQGQVYSIDNNGNVHKLDGFGRYYGIAGMGTVFGHAFNPGRAGNQWAIDIRPSIWCQFPYNNFLLPHLSFELGIRYHFRNLFNNAKVRKIQKIR